MAEHARAVRSAKAAAEPATRTAGPSGEILEDRPEPKAIEERKRMLNARPALVAQRAASEKLSRRSQTGPRPVQRRANPANPTGLPDGLKTAVEALSGFSMDDVKVHHGSSAPAGLGAAAYTQGSAIHVGPGQERHLAHEAWHVVQRKQGRVKPTLQMKGSRINDDPTLEREADAMGGRADGLESASARQHGERRSAAAPIEKPVLQRKVFIGSALANQQLHAISLSLEGRLTEAERQRLQAMIGDAAEGPDRLFATTDALVAYLKTPAGNMSGGASGGATGAGGAGGNGAGSSGASGTSAGAAVVSGTGSGGSGSSSSSASAGATVAGGTGAGGSAAAAAAVASARGADEKMPAPSALGPAIGSGSASKGIIEFENVSPKWDFKAGQILDLLTRHAMITQFLRGRHCAIRLVRSEGNPASVSVRKTLVLVELATWYFETYEVGYIMGMLNHEFGIHPVADDLLREDLSDAKVGAGQQADHIEGGAWNSPRNVVYRDVTLETALLMPRQGAGQVLDTFLMDVVTMMVTGDNRQKAWKDAGLAAAAYNSLRGKLTEAINKKYPEGSKQRIALLQAMPPEKSARSILADFATMGSRLKSKSKSKDSIASHGNDIELTDFKKYPPGQPK